MPKCRQCSNRQFDSVTSLYQHYRQAPGHSFCLECNKYFQDEDVLARHNAATHPEFNCPTCKIGFLTQSSLDDHYRGKAEAIHPKCPRCGKGFLNQASLKEHAVAFHSDLRCTACRRHFPAEDELKEHFALSPDHPKCPKCAGGFFDDAALHEHIAAEHLVPSSVLSASAAPITNMLPIDDVPAVSRLMSNRQNLPPPGKEQSHRWNQTTNKVISPSYEPELSESTALVLSAPPPNSSVISGRRDWQATPRPVMLSNQSAIEFTAAGSSVNYQRSQTLSPQSSTSSFQSVSYAELSEGSSGVDPVRARRGPMSLECPLCNKTPCIKPTAVTVCGHVFCNACITHYIKKTSECPQCSKMALLYCLLELRLDG
ncbi:hypothetical protein FB451DRAFT_1436218 [Mycena latifolia]|nr:hypothetical protein FB451DRAFT_1436218 [Mycena latifolia]